MSSKCKPTDAFHDALIFNFTDKKNDYLTEELIELLVKYIRIEGIWEAEAIDMFGSSSCNIFYNMYTIWVSELNKQRTIVS